MMMNAAKRGAKAFDNTFARIGGMGRAGNPARADRAVFEGGIAAGKSADAVAEARRNMISRGRSRAMWGGGGLFALSAAQRTRSPSGRSSGSSGMTPHSSGGATMM